MQKYLDSRGDLTFTVVGSSGDGMLWLHGYTMNAWIWENIWALLPNKRHIGVNLPGHGDSGPLNPADNLVHLARRLGDLAYEFGARHIAGLSFGGMVAIQVAIEYPGRFDTLVVNSPALGGGPQDRHAQTRNIELMELYRQRGAGPWLGKLWMQLPSDIFKGAASNPRLYASLESVVSTHRWDELSDTGMQRFTSHRQSETDLRKIKARTLVLIGEDDMMAAKRTAEIICRSVPRARRYYIPGCGHLGMLEVPEFCAARIAEHLATVWG